MQVAVVVFSKKKKQDIKNKKNKKLLSKRLTGTFNSCNQRNLIAEQREHKTAIEHSLRRNKYEQLVTSLATMLGQRNIITNVGKNGTCHGRFYGHFVNLSVVNGDCIIFSREKIDFFFKRFFLSSKFRSERRLEGSNVPRTSPKHQDEYYIYITRPTNFTMVSKFPGRFTNKKKITMHKSGSQRGR